MENTTELLRNLQAVVLFAILRPNIRKPNSYFTSTKLHEVQLESSLFVVRIKFKHLKNVNFLRFLNGQ